MFRVLGRRQGIDQSTTSGVCIQLGIWILSRCNLRQIAGDNNCSSPPTAHRLPLPVFEPSSILKFGAFKEPNHRHFFQSFLNRGCYSSRIWNRGTKWDKLIILWLCVNSLAKRGVGRSAALTSSIAPLGSWEFLTYVCNFQGVLLWVFHVVRDLTNVFFWSRLVGDYPRRHMSEVLVSALSLNSLIFSWWSSPHHLRLRYRT